jgi:hypothetical protein
LMKAELDRRGHLEERGDEGIRKTSRALLHLVDEANLLVEMCTISAAPPRLQIGTSPCGNKPCPQPGASRLSTVPLVRRRGPNMGRELSTSGPIDKGQPAKDAPSNEALGQGFVI